MDRTIEAISFGPDGVRLTYMNGNDVRAEGAIYQAHTICVSWAHDGLADDVNALEDAANTLLREALTVWAKTRPVDLRAEQQEALFEDDDEGLGG